MQVKIFHGRNWRELEDELNKWLREHPVSPESMRTEFSTVMYEDETSYAEIHTLILFYVPMRMM